MQGEDLFLDGLPEPYRTQSLDLIRRQTADVDLFIAVSEFYVARMHEFLGIPLDKIAVVPLGINTDGYEGPRPEGDGVFRVGYFARVAPEKGLRELAEAYRVLRQDKGLPKSRLEAAGYLGDRAQGAIWPASSARCASGAWATSSAITARSTASQKIEFLRGLDVLSVPGRIPIPRARICSRRWPPARRSCSPGVAPMSRLSSAPAAACSSSQPPTPWPKDC